MSAAGWGARARKRGPRRHGHLTAHGPASFPRSCKQNQDLLSFYAVVMGLDNAAVSRLRLTWEVMASDLFPFLSAHRSWPTWGSWPPASVLTSRAHPSWKGAPSSGRYSPGHTASLMGPVLVQIVTRRNPA